MPWGSSPVRSHGQAWATGAGPRTTTAIDTTGADTIFVTIAHQTTITPSDSVGGGGGNTWTLIRTHDNGSGAFNSLYRLGSGNAVVGANHTFTIALGASTTVSIAVEAWAGGATSSIDDQENSGGGIFGTTIKPGLILPGAANTLVITGVTFSDNDGTANTIDAGFTVAGAGLGSGLLGCSMAYLVQGAAANADPTWTATTSATHRIATIANFNPGAEAGGGDLSAHIGEPITGSSVLN